MINNRYKASAFHLLGSLVVAAISASLVYFVWYPEELAVAAGVTSIFLILLAVDVVIGPLITLIVFNPFKKELKRDLLVVLLLQLSALAYGLHTVWIARPVYEVYNAGRFDLVFANDFDDRKLVDATSEEFGRLPWLGPRLIGAKSPSDTKLRNELLLGSLTGGDDLPHLPQYYTSYDDLKAEVRVRLQPLSNLRNYNTSRSSEVEALEKRYEGRDVGYLPLRGKVRDLTVIVDAKTAAVLERVALDPW